MRLNPRAPSWLADVAAIAFMVLVVAAIMGPLTHRPQLESGLVQFTTAEQAVVAKVDDPPPSAGWRRMALPDSWRFTGPYSNGAAWYRFVWRGPDAGDSAALLVPWVAYAAEIRVNDDTLFRSRRLTEPLSREQVRPIYTPIPDTSLRTGANLILIKVVGRTQLDPGLAPIMVGPRAAVFRQWKWESALRREVIFASIGSLLSGLAISAVLSVSQGRERHHVWFVFASLAWLWLVQDSLADTSWPFATLDSFARGSAAALDLLVFGVWRAILTFFDHSNRLERIGLTAYLGASLAFTLGAPATMLGLVNDSSLVGAGLVVSALTGWVVWASFRYHRLDYWAMAFALCITLVGVIHDVLGNIGVIGVGQGVPWLFLGGLVFIAGMTAAFGLRYASAIGRLAAFNAQLREAVTDARAEMMRNLADEHPRAVSEAKQGERMLVGYDLQAGLYGALEDAISGLEDDPGAVPADAFPSVLRSLRDDLDLIFESHATPDAGALRDVLTPMRRRWQMAFGLKGVACQWADDGALAPDLGARRNLDLMRIINEALNGALVQEGVSSVWVQIETSGDVVRARVAFDGPGLDLRTGEPARGLQSMRIWARRLGAVLDIESAPDTGADIRFVAPLYAAPG